VSESICDAEVVIACCGNPLFGDNGFATSLVPVLKQKLNGATRLKVVDFGRGYFLFGILECKKLVLVDSIEFRQRVLLVRNFGMQKARAD